MNKVKILLKPYIGFSQLGINEGACLIFAHHRQEAKKLAYPVLSSWSMIDEYTDIRIRWMKDKDFLYDEANKEKLKTNTPHVIKDPKSCDVCMLWGNELENGICKDCYELKYNK
jgi:hypothetical protein